MAAAVAAIDHAKLYSDLLYRFEYVSSFVGLGESDIKAIKDSAPLIAPLVPVIVDAVYTKLFSFDITRNIFLKPGEGFHGKVASTAKELSLDDPQIKFRKDFLAKYLVKLVTAEYDAKFVAYLDRVGRIHSATPGKESRINVEYIHINALFGWLHGFLAETIDTLPQLQDKPAVRAKTLAAFSKLLWIQNDFFAMYYMRDSELFQPSINRTAAAPSSGAGLLGAIGLSGEKGLMTLASVIAVSAICAWRFVT